MFFGKILTVPFSTQVYKWVPANLQERMGSKNTSRTCALKEVLILIRGQCFLASCGGTYLTVPDW